MQTKCNFQVWEHTVLWESLFTGDLGLHLTWSVGEGLPETVLSGTVTSVWMEKRLTR
jgi:hypothetical protein